MRNIPLIIFYNRAVNEAKKRHDTVRACEMLNKLHRLERKDKVKRGDYRLETA